MARQLEPRETAAVLAGLRLLQAWREDKVRTSEPEIDVAIDDIESSSGQFEPMSSDEIDDLCEAINIGDVE